MSAWQELVSTAVVGTERRGAPAEAAAQVAAIMADQVPADGAEEQVLVAAGVLGAWRRAGTTVPPGDGPPPDPAPDDDRPAAPARAVQLLELLLDGQADLGGASTALVADWLDRCARSGHRPPARTLPRILGAATTKAALRAPAVAAGGPALRWLAARNPAWAWASPAADPAGDVARVWADGTRDERLAALAALRADDPPRARALLEETWRGESAADRTRFVEVLATGLSPDDEPFLEAALDDRSRTVRAAVAALLATLPAAALARRMTERLRPLLTVETRDRRLVRSPRRRLVVEPPEEIDAAAVRDGIVARGAPSGTGRRTWALVQMVGATPLAFWERELEGGPQEVIPLGAGSDALLAGWTLAAARQRDAAWARELLRHRPDPELLAAVPPRAAHDLLATVLPRVGDDAILPLLGATPAPWPETTSAAVINRLRAAEHRRTPTTALSVLATALDPEVASQVTAWTDTLRRDDPLRSRLHTVIQALSLRQAIARELG